MVMNPMIESTKNHQTNESKNFRNPFFDTNKTILAILCAGDLFGMVSKNVT